VLWNFDSFTEMVFTALLACATVTMASGRGVAEGGHLGGPPVRGWGSVGDGGELCRGRATQRATRVPGGRGSRGGIGFTREGSMAFRRGLRFVGGDVKPSNGPGGGGERGGLGGPGRGGGPRYLQADGMDPPLAKGGALWFSSRIR